jgi:hypothetical protein
MLQRMEQPGKNLPSPIAQSFAGLLASLAAPEENGTDRSTARDDEELPEDVVTLSYERALRAQATHEGGASETGAADEQTETQRNGPRAGERDGAAGKNLRTESVTIRLSHGESEMLRQRAAEVGLTVSAYVRSCMLEADTLRAQVKEALAEMKTTAGNTPAPTRKLWTGWMGRIRKRK